MVALGSGGAVTGKDFILDELPYAQGLQFITLFRNLRGIETEPATGGVALADVVL